ncbi:MAG: hypothetical protein AB1467_00675 [Candidatus Diapherotrites archaeon]
MKIFPGKKKIEAKRIDLLVHPLWGVLYFRPMKTKNKLKLEKKDVKFMSSLWGKRINEIAKDPNRIIVIINPVCGGKPYLTQLNRLINYAKTKLGQRLILIENSLTNYSNKKIIKEFKKRNIVINPLKVEGRSYGELYQGCVKAEQKRLSELLGIPKERFFSEQWISIDSDIRHKGLSKYGLNLRKQSRPLRNLRRRLKRQPK